MKKNNQKINWRPDDLAIGSEMKYQDKHIDGYQHDKEFRIFMKKSKLSLRDRFVFSPFIKNFQEMCINKDDCVMFIGNLYELSILSPELCQTIVNYLYKTRWSLGNDCDTMRNNKNKFMYDDIVVSNKGLFRGNKYSVIMSIIVWG